MRTIKFRAFCQVCNEMVHVYDSFFQYKDGIMIQCPNHYVHTETQIMQFTGLTDKNGVEIYEGDIVKINTPYRESQTHYGENIPRPSGSYTEQLEPEIKTSNHPVKFDKGMFYIKTFSSDGHEELSPLAYDLLHYTSRDELMYSFCSSLWIDKNAQGEDDLGYLLEQYPPNTEKELMEYLSSCEVIGNIYENPELLEAE